MPKVVSIEEFTFIPRTASRQKFRDILQKEGQIVPLNFTSGFEFVEWYGNDYLQAARDLGWEGILITWPGE